jgi:hypothetical protein
MYHSHSGFGFSHQLLVHYFQIRVEVYLNLTLEAVGILLNTGLSKETCRRRTRKWSLVGHLHENSKVTSGGHEAQKV